MESHPYQRLLTFYIPVLFGVCALLFLPDRSLGPFNAINPHLVAKLVLALVLMNQFGRMAAKVFGRRAIALMGFFGGFTSSTATIAAMGVMARKDQSMLAPASTAAVLSNVATFIQLALIVGLTSQETLMHVFKPLLVGGLSAVLYAALMIRSQSLLNESKAHYQSAGTSAWQTLLIAAGLSVMMMIVAALNHWYGRQGINWSAVVSGMVDAHMTAISISNLVAEGQLDVDYSRIPILLALSANTLMKVVVTLAAGRRSFSVRVIPGLVIMLAATWIANSLFP